MMKQMLLLALFAADSTGDPVAETRAALERAKREAASAPRAATVARERYLRRAEITDVRLSPNGLRVSFLRRTAKGIDVMLQEVSGGAETRVVAGLQRAETAWSGDGRRLWIADEQGLVVMENGAQGAASSTKRVFKWDARRSQRLFTVDARAPQYALIHEKVVEKVAGREEERHRYLRVDAQGKSRLLLEAALPVRSALLNASGELAYTAAFDGVRYETVIRDYSATGPRELLRCASIEACSLVGYNATQNALWVLSQHDEDKLSLRRWKQDGRRWETVHRDPASVADADALLWSATREDWLAVAYHGAGRRWYGNANENGRVARGVIAALERQLPVANVALSASTDGRVWLVNAQQADFAADRHYIYRPDKKRLQQLFLRENETADAVKRMPPPGAAMHPVSYRARDGMLLHGYVMLPAGVRATAAPLIAWLHGGPIARVYDEYNGGLQLLVNRGYAVFVPNFRASSGYGLKYVLAANGDVGNGRVLADIVDGMDFLLAQGIGDRTRQAVMGLSFGGYASLLAVSHQPTRFRFAFAGVPPTEYGWIKQWQAEHDSEAIRGEGAPVSLQFPNLGFPYKDAAWREKMRRESPLASLSAVKAPMYIWAGERDDHVPIKSIVNYVGEARRLGKQLGFLIDPDGGHGPRTALGLEASLYMMELAAHRHLGGALSPVSPELAAFLERNMRIDIDARRFGSRPANP